MGMHTTHKCLHLENTHCALPTYGTNCVFVQVHNVHNMHENDYDEMIASQISWQNQDYEDRES